MEKPPLKPYNKAEWQRIAQEFLADYNMPASALQAAHIALRRDDPTLAEKCLTEAARRRKRHT
jgi:hypothetical protein